MSQQPLHSDDSRVIRSDVHDTDVIVSDSYVRAYLEVAASRGADPHQLLVDAGCEVNYPDGLTELTLDAFLGLLDRIIATCDMDGLGIEVGLKIPPTAFGMVGFAAMSSETVRDSLEVSARYWHLLQTGLDMEIIMGPDWTSIRLSERQKVPENICRLLREVAVVSAYRVLEIVVGDTRGTEIHVVGDHPEYLDRYRDRLPTIIAGAEQDLFRMPSSLLDRRLPTASPMGLLHALEQCRTLEDQLAAGDYPTILQISQTLKEGSGQFPTLEELASRFSLPVRDLRRYLESQGCSYRTLLEEAKCARAKDLLGNNAYGISAIADELGYQGGGNFSRAFRRWTGMSPAEYRQQMAGLTPAEPSAADHQSGV